MVINICPMCTKPNGDLQENEYNETPTNFLCKECEKKLIKEETPILSEEEKKRFDSLKRRCKSWKESIPSKKYYGDDSVNTIPLMLIDMEWLIDKVETVTNNDLRRD